MSEPSHGHWIDRPVLVTGAGGLLGGRLAERLIEAGASVVCLLRDYVPQSEFVRRRLDGRASVVRGDVADQALMERVLGEYEVRTVFHLAAQTIVGTAGRNPVSTFSTNVAGTVAVLEACRRSPLVAGVVVAGSDKAYGEQPPPCTEETPLTARSPYDVSKACADMITRSYAQVFGVPAAVTRCANLYGAGDLNWSRLIPGTIRSLVRGRRPVIRSDGGFVREYLYVDDAASACLLLAERLSGDRALAGQAFNFSDEIPTSVLEMVRRIAALMESPLEPEILNTASNEIRRQGLDCGKARRLLGWRPASARDDALRRTIEWYRGFLREGRP